MTELSSARRMADLLEKLRQAPSLVERLPTMAREMVQAALNGATIYEIAQVHAVTEAAVWEVLANAAHTATGQSRQPIERGGGLGSDPSPGAESMNSLDATPADCRGSRAAGDETAAEA